MAGIRIQTQETFIPVEIGELEFKFMLDDESLNKLRYTKEDFEKKGKKIEKKKEANEISEKEEFEETKKLVADAYDHILGESAFDQVYKQTPNLQFITKYFIEVAEGLTKELEERGFTDDQKEKMEKYLKNSKKK